MSGGMSDDIIIPEDIVNLFWAATTSEALLFLVITADT